MQLDCKGSSIAANKPTKKYSRSSAGNFRISNLEGFPQKVKCEACSQSGDKSPHNGDGYGNNSARSRSGSLAIAAIIAAAFANRIAMMFGSDNSGVSSGSKPC